jgi:pimeloyl-ACP methyl ester carboxylesterase
MQKFLANMKKTKNLEKIDKPVLVIYGDKDFVVLPRHEKSVADSIPKSKLIIIKGMGHTFFNQELEMKIETYIVDFLKTLKK